MYWSQTGDCEWGVLPAGEHHTLTELGGEDLSVLPGAPVIINFQNKILYKLNALNINIAK